MFHQEEMLKLNNCPRGCQEVSFQNWIPSFLVMKTALCPYNQLTSTTFWEPDAVLVTNRWYREMQWRNRESSDVDGEEGRRKVHKCHAEDHELLSEDVKRHCEWWKAMEEWKILKQVYLQVCLLYVTGLQVRSSQLFCENIPMGRNFFCGGGETFLLMYKYKPTWF